MHTYDLDYKLLKYNGSYAKVCYSKLTFKTDTQVFPDQATAIDKEKNVDEALLGISLLKECPPKLCLLMGMYEHQFASVRGQTVVHYHLLPLPKVPEIKAKQSSIPALLKALVRWHNTSEQFLVVGAG